MIDPQIQNLETKLNHAASKLKNVTGKKMFGCHSLFAKENIFALIWKEGQIGVKIPDAESYQEILALKGAKPWKAGNRQMAHWVLLPDSVQGNSAKLAKWVGLAHGLAMRVVPKVKKKSLLKKP